MFLYNTFYALREEALKSWEHCVCDELMYCGERVDGNTRSAGDDFVPQGEMIRHLRGRWWEILIHHRNGDYYCVLVEPMVAHACLKSDFPPGTRDGNKLMLVDVGKFMQKPQGVIFRFHPIRCVVRLKRLNDLSGIVGDVLQESLNVTLGITIVHQVDRESRPVIGGRSGDKRQLPGEVIQCGAQVMEDVTSDDSYPYRNGSELKAVDIFRLVRIEILADKTERFSIVPSADSIVECLYMFRRPIESTTWPVERLHPYCQRG